MAKKTETDEPEEGLDEKIRRVIGETLGSLFDSGKADVHDDDDDEPPKKGEKSEPSDIGALVKREVAKLRRAEEREAKLAGHDKDIADLKAKSEQAPKPQQRRSTKLMWGSSD